MTVRVVSHKGHVRLEKKHTGLAGPLLSFLIAAITAFAIFLPFLVVDKGFFLYCGDYNEQQIPFYMYVQGFLKDNLFGGGTWSWATDLGSSVVNAYSFYNIGSPFLWLTLLFPNSWMPFLMVPLFCLKFGCIAAAACLYLGRYARTRNMAVITSLIYAFCGFNIYNTFFNHMLEPVILFTLMLWALDGFMYDGRRGFFALFVGLALLDNYYFFVGNVVFVLLYFVVKLACREYTLSWKRFGGLALETVLGVGMGMALALPSFLDLLNNPRIDNFSNGMNLLLYWHVHQYFNIITSLFLPPDPPYMPNLFTEGAIKWSSMSAWLPVVGMAGVLAYCRSRRGGSIKKMLFISLVMAMVPVLNSSYMAFNASYYARWFYMPVLMMALATLRALEDDDINLIGGCRWAVGITLVYAAFGLVPNKTAEGWKLGVAQDDRKFWLTFLTALFAIMVFYAIVHFFRGRLRFGPVLLAAVLGFSVFYSVIHISLGKFPQWDRDSGYREMQYDGARALALPDDVGFYRIDTYNAHDNLGLWTNRSSIRTFNSTVNSSIMEFYPLVGVKRDVSSKPEIEKYALRGLLSVRYTVIPNDEVNGFLGSAGAEGWQFLMRDGPYSVFENENFVPLGFTYTHYLPMESLQSIREDDRAAVLMRGIGLDEEQQQRYAHLFEGQAVTFMSSPQQQDELEEDPEAEPSGWYQYDSASFTRYVEDCNDRRKAASYATSYDETGFTSQINLQKDNLVFFAVPYDTGWSATVNGSPAEVLKVSGGLMAVEAPRGNNTIVFTYRTPGLRQGLFISLAALVLLVLYLLMHRLWFYLRWRRVRQNMPHGAASIGIIGGSDGPTAIFRAKRWKGDRETGAAGVGVIEGYDAPPQRQQEAGRVAEEKAETAESFAEQQTDGSLP